MSKVFDLFIIGGGINGAGLARDAAGRGLSVCLADKGEIGGATSSWSTKLIHGGLRYLENYEFKLVRESLKEREIVYKIARHISKPIPFIIPHTDKIRPAWLIKFGLFLYDNLGGKTNIPKSKTYDLAKKFPNLPDHVKIINSKSNLSTFSLLQFMDCCVTVRGTIGIEAACFGIPVITAGTGRYEKFGFTINSRNTKQYFKNLSTVESLSRINNTNAIYYAYAILFSKQLPIKKINISFDKSKSSNLRVELNSENIEISSDIKQISSWLSSKKEDLLVN